MQMRTAALLVTISTLMACASMPQEPDDLIVAREAVQRMQSEPLAMQFEDEAKQAEVELTTAERLFAERKDMDIVKHRAHLATQYAKLVLTQADNARVQQEVAATDEKRQALLLEAREREAQQARQQAAASQRAADGHEERADQAIATAEQEASRADRATRKAEQLAGALEQLQAEQTERGTVFTLTDVLFDTDQSTLKPGAERSLDALAAYLDTDHPNSIVIEGHTDSRGADDYNKNLSNARANSVRNAMIERGIPPERIEAVGRGEAFPVAVNSTEAGRQQNRRVEIVVSPK